jgi:hypothetical protein
MLPLLVHLVIDESMEYDMKQFNPGNLFSTSPHCRSYVFMHNNVSRYDFESHFYCFQTKLPLVFSSAHDQYEFKGWKLLSILVVDLIGQVKQPTLVSIQYVAKYYRVVVYDFTFYGVLKCKAMPLQHSFYDSSGNHNAYLGFKHMDLEFSVSAKFSLHLHPHIAIVSLVNDIGKNAWLSQSLEYFVQDFIDISAYDYSIGSSLELSVANGGKTTPSQNAHIPHGFHERFSTINQAHKSYNSIIVHLLFHQALVCGTHFHDVQDILSYVVIPTFNIKPVLAYTTIRSKQTIKLAQVLIFATWQQISSSDSMSFLYTCASCENFQDLNGDNMSKSEGGNLTMTLTIIAPHECFSFIGLDDGSSWTHHGNLIFTGGNGDSLYLWKYVGDDRRVLYIGSDAETLALKKSHEFKKKFLWVELFLVKMVFVIIQNSLIIFAIHFMAAQDLQRAKSGVYYFSHTARALRFKQWDPGGCCLVNRECPLDLEILGKLFMSYNTIYLNFNLEDKVDFKGEGIVMSLSSN